MSRYSTKFFLFLLGSLIVTTLPTIAVANSMMDNGGGMMNHNMSLGPADTQYDLRFIDGMMLHHQGAVEMAKEALSKSKRPEMKQLAQEIITAQKKEIDQMQKWRKAWYPKAGNTPIAWYPEMKHSMEMSTMQKQSMMMSMNLGKGDAKFDLRFIDGMIPHHQGAVEMAKDALNKSQRPEIKQLAKDIIASQQLEIDQMKQWRKAWYGK